MVRKRVRKGWGRGENEEEEEEEEEKEEDKDKEEEEEKDKDEDEKEGEEEGEEEDEEERESEGVNEVRVSMESLSSNHRSRLYLFFTSSKLGDVSCSFLPRHMFLWVRGETWPGSWIFKPRIGHLKTRVRRYLMWCERTKFFTTNQLLVCYHGYKINCSFVITL